MRRGVDLICLRENPQTSAVHHNRRGHTQKKEHATHSRTPNKGKLKHPTGDNHKHPTGANANNPMKGKAMSTKSPPKVKPTQLGNTRIMREIQRVLDDPTITAQQAMWQIKRAVDKVPPATQDKPSKNPKGGVA